MIFAYGVGAMLIGLVILYLTRPRLERALISSARFFVETPHPSPTWTFSLRNLLLPCSFWLQAAMLMLLLAALILASRTVDAGIKQTGVGVWFILDTSASMMTQQSGMSRLTLGIKEIEAAVKTLEALPDDIQVCATFSTFDLVVDTQASDITPEQVLQRAAATEVRMLGTDINLLHTLISSLPTIESSCAFTHMVVVTDQPAPEWTDDPEEIGTIALIWSDIAEAIDNVGLVDVSNVDQLIFGGISRIQIQLAAYNSEADATVSLSTIDGVLVDSQAIQLTPGITRSIIMQPPSGGGYEIKVTPGGAYSLDDSVAIEVTEEKTLQVDWRLADTTLPTLLGLSLDPNAPIRIVAYPAPIEPGDPPTLLVGSGYLRAGSLTPIDYFVEASPLLNDLNLDVAENLRIQGVDLSDPPWTPVVKDQAGRVWLATRDNPPAAYVPGLPVLTSPDENLSAFSTTVFFNGIRLLLSERQPSALFTLTTPDQPLVDETHAALHPGEGDTASISYSIGNLSDLSPRETPVKSDIWVVLLAGASFLMLLERSLAMFGGHKWIG